MNLTPEEIAAVKALRDRSLSKRSEFFAMANEVCELLGVPLSKIRGVTRGSPAVCEARNLICKLAFDRGIHPTLIGQYIGRDRTSVLNAIERAEKASAKPCQA